MPACILWAYMLKNRLDEKPFNCPYIQISLLQLQQQQKIQLYLSLSLISSALKSLKSQKSRDVLNLSSNSEICF